MSNVDTWNHVVGHAVAPDPVSDLRHDGLVTAGDDAEVVREVGDPEEHHDRDDAERRHDGLGVASLGRLESLHAVGHRLDSGQRGAAGGVASQEQNKPSPSRPGG